VTSFQDAMTPITVESAQAIDNKLSNRFIELDEKGYFLIYLDRDQGLICADLYSNAIDDRGIACDPETGKPLPCDKKIVRRSVLQFQGRTAKALCVEIFEKSESDIISRLEHAAYLGREFVRAEIALYSGDEYVQD
jgi:dihydropteroate synthase